MSGLSQQDTWVKQALGFDVAAAMGAGGMADGKEAREPEDVQNGGQEGDDEKFSLSDLAFWRKKKPTTPTTDTTETTTPKDQELAAKLKALDDKIAELKKLGFGTKGIKAERDDYARAGSKAESETDEGKRTKALADVKQRIDDQVGHADTLLKKFKEVMGDKKGSPSAAQKTEIFKKALESQYGLTVTIPDGMDNTHLDRVYDMFGSVPKGDGNQDKLKKLTYVKTGMSGSGSYNRGSFEVKMGDFGSATGTENYEIDGEVLPANSFDVTTLHEIGHSVDNKHGFMNANGSAAGCGGWEATDPDKVTLAYLPECKKAGLSDKVTDEMLKTAIHTAVTAGTTNKPDNIEQGDWTKILKFLVDYCLPIRAASKPWFKASKVVVNGKVYQEAYSDGRWYSYSHSAIAATKVNDYQWRAPGEWFAEVYAISWLKKKKPPSGVDAKAAALMWQG